MLPFEPMIPADINELIRKTQNLTDKTMNFRCSHPVEDQNAISIDKALSRPNLSVRAPQGAEPRSLRAIVPSEA
jgi:hypothetical protein